MNILLYRQFHQIFLSFSSNSNRIRTSSCQRPSLHRKPLEFLPYSTKPCFLYKLIALSFSETTSSSNCKKPAFFAHSMQAFVSASPMPSPQYSFLILIPNSARCRIFAQSRIRVLPAEPAHFPSTKAQISTSVPLHFVSFNCRSREMISMVHSSG